MRKKQLLAGMIAGILLLVSACSQGNGEDSGNQMGTQSEPPVTASQPETSQPAEPTQPETPQPDEPTQPEKTPASYIFSEMPVAAYEVTGLSVGLDAEVYQEHIFEQEFNEDIGVIPLVKLDPSKKFLLICTQRAEVDDYVRSSVTIHSPEGSGLWSATIYGCHDYGFPEIEGYSSGYPALSKESRYTITESDHNGEFDSLNDPWTEYITFSEIWHSGASPEDVIHVIEIKTYDYDDSFDELDEVKDALVQTLMAVGAVDVQEIPVEEALTRCSIVISSESAN